MVGAFKFFFLSKVLGVILGYLNDFFSLGAETVCVMVVLVFLKSHARQFMFYEVPQTIALE